MLELVQSNEKKLYTVTKENWPQVFNEISNDVLNFFKSAYAKT